MSRSHRPGRECQRAERSIANSCFLPDRRWLSVFRVECLVFRPLVIASALDLLNPPSQKQITKYKTSNTKNQTLLFRRRSGGLKGLLSGTHFIADRLLGFRDYFADAACFLDLLFSGFGK